MHVTEIPDVCRILGSNYPMALTLYRANEIQLCEYIYIYIHTYTHTYTKEGNVLFNDSLNTFYLQLYGIKHMIKDHSNSERGNPLPPHGLLFSINSKGYFICTIPQTAFVTPVVGHWLEREMSEYMATCMWLALLPSSGFQILLIGIVFRKACMFAVVWVFLHLRERMVTHMKHGRGAEFLVQVNSLLQVVVTGPWLNVLINVISSVQLK